ncbi:MAG: redox-regulated ATPase YchF [Candidatus Promineifilaceae bacterium]|nr:redox-regulated ATPase YchF [Candidatus Promineifilaceae bacterium]
MALTIGIVGLPNVGKSTLFNALTQTQQAAAENYPFCTIEPNRAVVPIPDERVDKLAELTGVERRIQATIEFVDIAGLVRGASRGEGLGNQFLGHIRNTDAIVHVVRCFDDENVVHISAKPQPRQDIEIVATELALADLQQLERKIERLTGQVKGDRKFVPILEMAQRLQDHLGRGLPAHAFPEQDHPAFQVLLQEMRFLTAKPVIYAANVDEEGLAEDNDYVAEVRAVAAEQGAQVVKICAELEADMAGLTNTERREFLTLAGASESGLEQIIHQGYRLLGLISYFTFNKQEVRAWTIPQGWTAPQAAGVIHTDFERGFIRAEVVHFDVFVQHGSWAALKAAGALRSEGKEYVVQDGDVILFRFNV